MYYLTFLSNAIHHKPRRYHPGSREADFVTDFFKAQEIYIIVMICYCNFVALKMILQLTLVQIEQI